jgi:hypothetical protein
MIQVPPERTSCRRGRRRRDSALSTGLDLIGVMRLRHSYSLQLSERDIRRVYIPVLDEKAKQATSPQALCAAFSQPFFLLLLF